MKQTILTLLVALCALAGTANTAQAASKTVTYTITSEPVSGYTNRYKFTFVRSGNSFGYSSGQKTVTIPDITTSTGFHVELDDGLGLQLNLSKAGLTFGTYEGRTGIRVNYGGSQNDNLTLGSSHYYVTHVKMADLSGNALTGTANPWIRTSGQLDKDVDMVTVDDALGALNAFSATFAGAQTFGQLTVTYGDPREYAITFNDVEGLSNPNPASYNVTTSTFVITAPSRTGYTLGTVTYTDALHTAATPVNLSQTPMSIQRGDAVQRKAITFNASWTAHTYTLRLHHNDGTDGYTDQTLTYDQTANIQSVSRTGYVFTGWNTQADGNGTAYDDGESVTNLSAEQGATVELYAQWANPSGTCGDNATWEYDHATRTLTIGGSGAMNGYGANNQPWKDYKNYITTVDIGSGITHIGSSAFYNCTALATVNGGSGVNSIGISAFVSTVWISTISNTDAITYLGHVLVRGKSYTGTAVTVNDGTTAIYENAFNRNGTITSVTIPASMTSIGGEAFYNCTALANVNVLASTPPMLSSYAFYLEDDNKSLARTFNVRSADYKTASGWTDIYNKEYDYAGYTGTELRVVSTLALPDGFSTNAKPVAIAGTDYYAECTSITLSYTGSASLEGIKVNGSSDGVTNNGNDTFTFTMPAEDVTVSATWLDPHVITSYVDANGNLHENIAAIPLDNTMTTLEAGTYVVNSNVTYTSTVTTTGDVTLILADGCTMSFGEESNKLDATIMNCGGNLTIYGQAQGTGWLKAYISDLNGINTHIQRAYNYTQHSGNVIIHNDSGRCIYTYNFTLLGGTLDVDGGGNAYGDIQARGDISILGGQLWARGWGLYSNIFTLGYTNPTDLIYATSYTSPGSSSNPIKIVNGQTLVDENGDTWSDMIYNYDAIYGLTLRPFKTITLADDADNTSAISGWNGGVADVTLSGRTLYRDGDWNTLCLPFDVSTLTGTPLEGATLMELGNSGACNTGFDASTGTLTLDFVSASSIEAGHAYIVKWTTTGDPIVNPVFTGVTVENESPDDQKVVSADGYVTFQGTYSPEPIYTDPATNLYLGAENKLYYPSSAKDINSFRAYFQLNKGLTAGEPSNPNSVRGFSLGFGEDDEVTGIIEVTDPTPGPSPAWEGSAAWFSLDGRKLDGKPTKKGVYIYEGKKRVIK